MPAPQQFVARAMTAYVRAGFRLRVLGLEHLRIEPGMIFAVSHRSDNDVPVVISVLFPPWSLAVRGGTPWPTFAAADDIFLRGFLAGYTPKLPIAMRRALWPITVGPPLERYLQVVPVREPTRMRLVEFARGAPDRRLNGRLPSELTAALRARAKRLGRPEPRTAADILDGAYADLLWEGVDRDATADADDIWREHLRAAVADFGRLTSTLRDGGAIVVFPEGEPSQDGAIGPVLPGLASLARRGRARSVQPIAMAYDELVYGRAKAYVSIAPVLMSIEKAKTENVTRALRAATPLTAGQLAATTAATGGGPRELAGLASEQVALARAQGRPVEPGLDGEQRARALRIAFARARVLGVRHPTVARLAREFRSAAEI
jgi:1-acyl-sn-glycerol-3-phosphate acyltransferase